MSTHAFGAEVSPIYPARVALYLGGLPGPLYSPSVGLFDPRRDISIFVAGRKQTVQSYSYDRGGNRYLIFLTQPIDSTQVVQVIHHMPQPPFTQKITQGFSGAFGVNFPS